MCRTIDVIDVKTHADSSSGSRVKPLAILATVDLRPKPVNVSAPSTAGAESQAAVSDSMPNSAVVSWIICQ